VANVKVTYQLPTTRKSGRPLDPADIRHVRIELSADGGANFAPVAQVVPPTLEYTQTELEPGAWVFRAVVVDTAGRESDPVSGSIDIADETPPGTVQTLTLALA